MYITIEKDTLETKDIVKLEDLTAVLASLKDDTKLFIVSRELFEQLDVIQNELFVTEFVNDPIIAVMSDDESDRGDFLRFKRLHMWELKDIIFKKRLNDEVVLWGDDRNERNPAYPGAEVDNGEE